MDTDQRVDQGRGDKPVPRGLARRQGVQGLAAVGISAAALPLAASCSETTPSATTAARTGLPAPTPAPTSAPLVAESAISWYREPPTGLAQTVYDGRWYSLSDGLLTRRQRLAVETVEPWAWTWEVTDTAEVDWDYEQLVGSGHGVLVGRRGDGALFWHRDLSIGRNPMTWSINDGRPMAEGWQLAHLLALHAGHLLAVDPDGSVWWHQWLGDRWHPASGSLQVASDWTFDAAAAAGAVVYGATADAIEVRVVRLPVYVPPDEVPLVDVSIVGVVAQAAGDGLVAAGQDSFFVAPARAGDDWLHVAAGPSGDWGSEVVVTTPVQVSGPARAAHAGGGPVDLRHLPKAAPVSNAADAQDGVIPVDVYWRDQAVDRGMPGALALSVDAADTEVHVELWELSTPTLVTTMTVMADNQGVSALAGRDGCGWSTVEVPLPVDAASGLYAAAVRDRASLHGADPDAGGGVTLPTDRVFAPLVVRPAPTDTARLAVLANTNTWNAYNSWGGVSQYTDPFGTHLSFRRPSPLLHPADLLGTEADDDMVAPGHHLLAGEVRFLSWLRNEGHDWHQWSDADLHTGRLDLDRYQALLIHSHPEYWTVEMFDRLMSWLDSGGIVVNLGANGLYERVEISFDGEGQPDALVMRNGNPEGERDLLRFWGRRERTLLGVAFEGVNHDQDPAELRKGNATEHYAPYRVIDARHRFFADTGLADGDLFVTTDGEFGGAGWEVDTSWFDGHESSAGPAPGNIELLARGTLGERPGEAEYWNEDYNAHMTYYDHPGGGWVFSAGSLVFTHWMVEDPAAEQLVRNVLAEAVAS